MIGWALALSPVNADGPVRLTVVPEGSRVTIEVGKAGVLSFAGHVHEVIAQGVSGSVIVDEADPSRSSVSLEFRTAALRVNEKLEPSGDAPQVQETMLGPRVLDAAHYPTVVFRSSRVTIDSRSGDAAELRVEGAVTLHGVTRTLTLPVHVTLDRDGTLVARGKLSIRQTDYGITPVTAAGGTIRVKDELGVTFVLSARR